MLSKHVSPTLLAGHKLMGVGNSSGRVNALRNAPLDSWVALSSDETTIVATGSTYAEAAAKSEEAGVADPIIVKTPKRWLPLAV